MSRRQAASKLTQRWHTTLNSYVSGPIVEPTNAQLIMGSSNTLDQAGFIMSASTRDGRELWRVTLPPEDSTVFNSGLGIYGWNQSVNTKARFSADGLTAYLMTSTATGDNETSRSFVYALNIGNTSQPAPTPVPTPAATSLRSTNITLSAQAKRSVITVTGVVSVADEKGAAVSGASVALTWKLPGGGTQSQVASTNTKGSASFNIKGGPGTYTVTVTNITKTGYTFNAGGSVLTRSITK